VDVAGLFCLIQNQFRTLTENTPETTNKDILIYLIDSLDSDIFNPPKGLGSFAGVPRCAGPGTEEEPEVR
jgi:hypothetical protein